MLKAWRISGEDRNYENGGKTVEGSKKTVNRRVKHRKSPLPKKKVKVEKAAFDAVLEKLIQSKPVKRSG
jgi:hypothetical protein